MCYQVTKIYPAVAVLGSLVVGTTACCSCTILLNSTMVCDNEQCRQPCFSQIDDCTSRAYTTTSILSKRLPQLRHSRKLRKFIGQIIVIKLIKLIDDKSHLSYQFIHKKNCYYLIQEGIFRKNKIISINILLVQNSGNSEMCVTKINMVAKSNDM